MCENMGFLVSAASLPPCILESPCFPIPPFPATLPGRSSHLKDSDHHSLRDPLKHTQHPCAHIQSIHSFVHTSIDILYTATHTHRNTPSHSQTIVSNMQSQGQTITHPESLRVTKSHPKYTQSHKDADSHNHSCTHLVTHTCRVTKSLTHRQIQSNTQSHTQRNRHTQLHTGPWRRRTMDTLFGLAAAGEEGAAVWTEEAVGAAVPTPSLLQHPLNLFLFPEARFCWDLDLLRDWAPMHPPACSFQQRLVDNAGAPCAPGSFCGSGDSRCFSSDAPFSSWDHPSDLPLIPRRAVPGNQEPWDLLLTSDLNFSSAHPHPPAKPYQLRWVAPGSIVGSLLWPAQRCRSPRPSLWQWVEKSLPYESCSWAWCRPPPTTPKLVLLASHSDQAALDLNREFFQEFPYSLQPIVAGLLALSYPQLLVCAVCP